MKNEDKYLIFDDKENVFLGGDIQDFRPIDDCKVSYLTKDEVRSILLVLSCRKDCTFYVMSSSEFNI